MITFSIMIIAEVMKYRGNNEMKVDQGRACNLGQKIELTMNSDYGYGDQLKKILE